MRDPAETAIEDTCRFLERHMQSESWMADPDIRASDMRATADEIEASNLPDYAKHYAIFAVLEATKKRRGKPTRSHRDDAIRRVAIKLVMQGYKPTRNDVTRDKDSASSIICQALRRLGEKLSEKSINAIVAKNSRSLLHQAQGVARILRISARERTRPRPSVRGRSQCAGPRRLVWTPRRTEKVPRLSQHDESAPQPYDLRP